MKKGQNTDRPNSDKQNIEKLLQQSYIKKDMKWVHGALRTSVETTAGLSSNLHNHNALNKSELSHSRHTYRTKNEFTAARLLTST